MIYLITLGVGPPTPHTSTWPLWLAVATVATIYAGTQLTRLSPERGRQHQSGQGAGTGSSVGQVVAAAYPANPFTAFMGTGTTTAANQMTGLTLDEASPDLIRIVAENQQWAESMGYSPRNNPAHGALRHMKGEI